MRLSKQERHATCFVQSANGVNADRSALSTPCHIRPALISHVKGHTAGLVSHATGSDAYTVFQRDTILMVISLLNFNRFSKSFRILIP